MRSETFARRSGWQYYWVTNFSCVQGPWITFFKIAGLLRNEKYRSFLLKCLAKTLLLCSSWKLPVAVLERMHHSAPSPGVLGELVLLCPWGQGIASSLDQQGCLEEFLCVRYALLRLSWLMSAVWSKELLKRNSLSYLMYRSKRCSCAVSLALNTHSSTFALTS